MNNNSSQGSPAGLWYPGQLIGAIVRIGSLSLKVGQKNPPVCSGDLAIIKAIEFVVDSEGHARTGIVLRGLEDWLFGWKDLELIKLKCKCNDGLDNNETEEHN